MRQCTIAFCLESCQIKVEETCLQTYIIHLQFVYHSLIANMHLKVHFEQYFKGRPQSFISLVINIYFGFSPFSSQTTNCYFFGVDNKGVGLCNEAVPVQVRPFEVGGSRKTLPR